MAELLRTLVSFSERAGELARAIRQEPRLFTLLVEEKGQEEKNQRFAHDFKTLADVLIQEALRHCVAHTFPSLSEHVRGEESAEFTNTLGETITVRVCDSQADTAALLAKVLDGNQEAADILATLLHSDITSQEEDQVSNVPELPVQELGIWIDPIDSTGEYVRGGPGEGAAGFPCQGLPCVTVLIGLYHRHTGCPVAGVINQPFAAWDHHTQQWSGRVFWGVSYEGQLTHNLTLGPGSPAPERPVLVISSSEGEPLQEKLRTKFEVVHATGAGYKLLLVALGHATAALSSKGSTFRWDTCAPHALLQAEAGGLVSYKHLLQLSQEAEVGTEAVKGLQLTYHQPNDSPAQPSLQWSNEGGLVAYRDPSVLTRVLETLAG